MENITEQTKINKWDKLFEKMCLLLGWAIILVALYIYFMVDKEFNYKILTLVVMYLMGHHIMGYPKNHK